MVLTLLLVEVRVTLQPVYAQQLQVDLVDVVLDNSVQLPAVRVMLLVEIVLQ